MDSQRLTRLTTPPPPQLPPVHLPGAEHRGGRRPAVHPEQGAAGAGEAAAAGLQARHAEVPPRPHPAAGGGPVRPAGPLQCQRLPQRYSSLTTTLLSPFNT